MKESGLTRPNLVAWEMASCRECTPNFRYSDLTCVFTVLILT